MAFEKYGGYVWSDDPAYQERDWRKQGLALGVAVGAGLAATSYATTTRSDGTRLIDTVASMSRTGGNLSPGQILNTFRVPEFLSPLTSPTYKDMQSVGDGVYEMVWDQKYLKSNDTYAYLKELTGLTNLEMEAAGLRIDKGFDVEAERLVFQQRGDRFAGSLYSVVSGERRKIADNVVLQQFTAESPDLFDSTDKAKSINRAAQASIQAMDIPSKVEGFKHYGVFKQMGELAEGEFAHPKYFPVPGLGVEGGIKRGTTLIRAQHAFSMDRVNRLAEGFVDTMFGDSGNKAMKRIFGEQGIGIMPRAGSPMYLGMAKRIGGLAGLGLGIAQLDWARRHYGAPGEVAASAITSGGLAWAAHKAGLSARKQFFIGAASFFGQMVLPGFDRGVIPGLASTYVRSNQLRAMPVNPFNWYRRTLEGFLPGISSWEMGALAGVGAAAFAYGVNPLSGKGFAQHMLDYNRFGIPTTTASGRSVTQPRGVRQLFWERMHQAAVSKRADDFGMSLPASVLNPISSSIAARGDYVNEADRLRLRQAYVQKAYRTYGEGGVAKLSNMMNALWSEAEEAHKNLAKTNPFNEALATELGNIEARYRGGDLVSKAQKHIQGIWTQWKYSMLGATPGEEGAATAIRNKGFKVPLGRLGLVFGGTVLMQQVLTGGLLGSMEGSAELGRIYSGEQLIKVGKSRWWEGGGTPFEGMQTEYFRPHWYALMMNRVREKGIWGNDEDAYSPVGKYFRKNFTYQLERENYYDRPYPISSAAFADTPLIGGILAATVGRVIKPPRLMHTGEWIRGGEEGGLEYASVFEGYKREPSYPLGAPGPGVPSSPFEAANIASFMNYQGRELEGMTGWAKNVLSDLVVGTDTYFTGPQLAEAGMMTSHRLRFWESATGGGLFTNELIRRILPSYRKEIDRHNPIMNSMPSWLPDKFRYGDPYRVVEWGEGRLPGAGYEALHPELQGTSAEDYPLIYQYDILGNVAPFSKEFMDTRERVYHLRAAGNTNDRLNAWIDRIDAMVRERANIYDFRRADEHAIQLPGSGITQSAMYYAQKTLRKAVAPAEYLVPGGIRPVAKLMGDRQPIERYEFERMYGTPMAFWDEPWRDWFRPAMYSAANIFGFTGKPMWRQDADANAAYFDQVEFYKWMSLADQAEQMGDGTGARKYRSMANSTRFGVNPQGSALSMYWSLPQEERPFFNAFAFAEGGERKRIKQMVPGDQVHLYEAIWQRLDEGDPTLWAGQMSTPDNAYLQQQFYGIQGLNPMPPEDWIGWHEDVDVDDIRVKYVDELGKDLHDYGLWENQLRKANAQPYLENSTQYLHRSGGMGRAALGHALYNTMHSGMQGPSLLVNSSTFSQGHVNINYNDNREEEIRAAMSGALYGY